MMTRQSELITHNGRFRCLEGHPTLETEKKDMDGGCNQGCYEDHFG